jgi:hypothetical protein
MRQVVALLGALITLALIAGLVLWAVNQFGDSSNRATVEPTPAVTAEANAVPPQRLDQIEQALGSGDTSAQATVLSDEFAQALSVSGQPLVPAGATVGIKPETLTTNGAFAQVAATLVQADGGQQEFILSLQNQQGTWKVFLIEEKR